MKWLLRRYMVNAQINSVVELAKLTGITRRHLYEVIKDPHRIRLSELKALDSVLHFSDEDLIRLVRI